MIQLAKLTAVIEAIKTIRRLTPVTGNAAGFRAAIRELNNPDAADLARAIDTAAISVADLERTMLEVQR